MSSNQLSFFGQEIFNKLGACTKLCTVCKQNKRVTEFHADKHKPDGLYPHCKSCNRINTKNRKRLRQQNPPPVDSRCECCGQVKKLVLDHCHTTQGFRGWLCSDCNTALGKLGDNTQGVLKALNYLERFTKEQLFSL